VEKRVRAELEHLHQYARGVGRSAERFPDGGGIVDGGRGYLGGALTTLHHMGLVSDDELREWWGRLMDELPPTKWATFE
jgi:hypothetical protein